jgi:hypothetical protein
MDDLRRSLDQEARRVRGSDDALERVKRRAGRRRVARQVGTGALALGIAAGGFALAVNAFSGRPGTMPQAGPSGSISPAAPTTMRREEVYAFIDAFLAARRKGSDAEPFLSSRAQHDYSCCDLILYPAGGLEKSRVTNFDKFTSNLWIVQVPVDYLVERTTCYPLMERIEVLATDPNQGIGGLLIRAASIVDVTCLPPGSDHPVVRAGAPNASANLEQGGVYWAVYIAVDDESKYINRIAERMEEQGVPVSSGTIACDHGAAEELGVPNDVLAVAAYFDTNAEASAFFEAVTPSPVGTARVQTYCED